MSRPAQGVGVMFVCRRSRVAVISKLGHVKWIVLSVCVLCVCVCVCVWCVCGVCVWCVCVYVCVVCVCVCVCVCACVRVFKLSIWYSVKG